MSLKHKLIFFLTLFLFGIIFYRIYQIRFIRHDYYLEAYQKNTIKNITYKDAPRGRILDRKIYRSWGRMRHHGYVIAKNASWIYQ